MIHDVAGAFSITEKFGDDANTAQGTQILRKEDRISFNAANSNSAYGKATTVQPAALSCKLCIKYQYLISILMVQAGG